MQELNKKRSTILCVDDEDNILKSLKRLFEDQYNIIEAHSARESISIYQELHQQIDLILMDLIMPGEDGANCIKQIKKINSKAVCLIISGVNDLDLSIKEKPNDLIYAIVDKPWNDDELLDIVKQAVNFSKSL